MLQHSAAAGKVDWRSRAEELVEENRQLREAMGASPKVDFIHRACEVLNVPPGRAKMLSILLAGRVRGRYGIWLAYCDPAKPRPDVYVVDSLISYLRAALKPHGISITTIWGEGWVLDAENKARVHALLGLQRVAA